MACIATLNVNGINDQNKQLQLIDFVNTHNIDILMLQEHNLKSLDKIHHLFNSYFHIYVNPTINSKGGTAIIIKRSLPITVIDLENSADGRIMSLRISYCNQELHILNIYAHSGNNFINEREHLFQNEILLSLGLLQ